MKFSSDLMVMAAVALTSGAGITLWPERTAAITGNKSWLRSAPRRAFYRFAGFGFLALGVYGLACMFFPTISLFP